MRRVNVESMAISVGTQMLDALSQGAVQASQDLKRMAEEFIGLRDRARELAGVLGKPGNIEFTKEQIGFAAETGFANAGKAIDFRTAFQGEAQQYADRFKDAGEFAKFEKEAARLGNQNNVPPDVMAKIAGMVIRTGPKEGQTAESQMQRLGGSFKTMMAGSGAIGELSGQLGRMSGLVGEGNAFKTVEEAAVSTRMAAETNLPEAYTWATEMRQGVIELATDKDQEKAKELGITPETTNFDAIKRLSAAQRASGQNMDVFLSKYFPQKRIRDAFRDSIKAYNNGVMAKGLKDAAAVVPGQIEGETAAYFADPTQGGRLAMEKGRTALAEAQYSEERALVEPQLERARGETVAQRSSPIAKAITAMGETGMFRWLKGGFSGTEGLEYWKAYQNTRQEAEQAGVDVSAVQQPGALAGQRTLEHAMAQLIMLTKEANDHRARAATKPLSAPAPQPAAAALTSRGRATASRTAITASTASQGEAYHRHARIAQAVARNTPNFSFPPMSASETIRDYFRKLEALIETFNFERQGHGESLGKDAAGIVAESILDRSVADQGGPDGAWLANDPDYTARKRDKYHVELIGFRTGQMISLPSLLGQVDVTPHRVEIKYGTGQPPTGSMSSSYISAADTSISDVEKAWLFTRLKGSFFVLDTVIADKVAATSATNSTSSFAS